MLGPFAVACNSCILSTFEFGTLVLYLPGQSCRLLHSQQRGGEKQHLRHPLAWVLRGFDGAQLYCWKLQVLPVGGGGGGVTVKRDLCHPLTGLLQLHKVMMEHSFTVGNSRYFRLGGGGRGVTVKRDLCHPLTGLLQLHKVMMEHSFTVGNSRYFWWGVSLGSNVIVERSLLSSY